jgi:acyl carrier protein
MTNDKEPAAGGRFAKRPLTAIVSGPLGRGGLAGDRTRTGQVGLAMEDIEQKVIEIVSEQMGVDKSEITRETHFINDLNADSLDTVELVMEFEDEFELSIPDEEAEKIQTVGQAIDYIKQHSNK